MKEWMWWGRQRMCAQHRVSLSFRLITLIVARMVMMINMIMTRMMGMLTRMRIFSFRRVHPSEVDGCNNASTLPLIKDPGDELNEVNRNSPLWSRELSHIGFIGLGKVSYKIQGCTKILVLNCIDRELILCDSQVLFCWRTKFPHVKILSILYLIVARWHLWMSN